MALEHGLESLTLDPMRTTLNLDDELLAQALQLSGLTERNQLIREALLALVQRESARRLTKLGGTEPQLQPVARRLLKK